MSTELWAESPHYIGTPTVVETSTGTDQEYNEVCRLLHQVLHQRTGAMGLKVEDDLLRENEPLLLQCLKHTRYL